MKTLTLLLALAVSASAAAPTGILANRGKKKPVVTVANSYSEKVVRTFAGDANNAAVFDVVPNAEKVSAKVVALMGEYNFGGITADTEVAFTAGDFTFQATLGEAATKTIGANGNATFNFTFQTPLLDGDGNPKLDANENEMFSTTQLGSLKWVWNATSKTVTATVVVVIPAGGLPDTAGVTGIACAKFAGLGLTTVGGVKRFANVPLPVTVKFGEASGTRDVFLGGVTQTRSVQVRGVGADLPDTFAVTSVVIAGAADTRAPQLTVRMPKKTVSGAGFSVFGVLLDRPERNVSYAGVVLNGYAAPEVQVYVNKVPGEGVPPDFVLPYSDSRGNAALPGDTLNQKGIGYLARPLILSGSGPQILRFVATDSEGNSAMVTKGTTLSFGLISEDFIRVAAGTLPVSSPLGAEAVNAFFIGKHEVQWDEFQEVRTWAAANGYDIANAGEGAGPNHPVINVTWFEALKWCNARSERDGRIPVYRIAGAVYRAGQAIPSVTASANGYRLPSEKEWEFAARGGAISSGFTYSGSNNLESVAWFRGNSGLETHEVGQKLPNELGIYDMSGNAEEWCFDEVFFNSSISCRPYRGGGVFSFADGSEVRFRNGKPPLEPVEPAGALGFRVVVNAE